MYTLNTPNTLKIAFFNSGVLLLASDQTSERVDRSTDEITHSVTCDNCGEETFTFERNCHRCSVDRWEHN